MLVAEPYGFTDPFSGSTGWLDRYGDQEIPEAEIPQLTSLAVLVKSKRYDRESAVPEQWEEVDSIVGLVVNDIDSLKSDEEELLRETFPALSLDGVLILEQDRAPKSVSSSIGRVLTSRSRTGFSKKASAPSGAAWIIA